MTATPSRTSRVTTSVEVGAVMPRTVRGSAFGEVLVPGRHDNRLLLRDVVDRDLALGDHRQRAVAAVDGVPLGASDRGAREAALCLEAPLAVRPQLAHDVLALGHERAEGAALAEGPAGQIQAGGDALLALADLLHFLLQ